VALYKPQSRPALAATPAPGPCYSGAVPRSRPIPPPVAPEQTASSSQPGAHGGPAEAAGAESTRIEIEDNHHVRELCGEERKNLRSLERAFGVRIGLRGNVLTLSGEAAGRAGAEQLVRQLVGLLQAGFPLTSTDISHAAGLAARGHDVDPREYMLDTVVMSSRRRPIGPRSPNQKRYVDAIRHHDIVFAIGPAGTGKTYLAVAMAVAALHQGEIRRIVLTRPAVEAGEKLGFLPGDLAEKVNPYLRPLYDALHDLLEPHRCQRLIEEGTIEIAPLAFMRGRTLNKAFVILDEAQNTTPEQMKMFLTRLGAESRAVVTGDITQVDLPEGRGSGLVEARRILAGIPEIPFILFERADVLRHPLVQRIVEAYEVADAQRNPGDASP
jgi:phosphate starvation-inducible PhoH-like protein